ncbi:hypothetical protein HG535_0F03330 [Zygotorulaspora mrakii]|uniref:AMP-activated protein kinase glycogen-binding domain-containing protein n=1 Tax=Zygotorulaspora mrakii TaxID=42260 RepID=A0A7H9B7W7_ZYGMR|nr:uncharacterized protein HG535_0F03330 [Zygotorulaspora mrakii]QLG73822.1 hypothetical protein HG535_0F03330 [Zygotorulaspora mrakii]
MSNILLVIPSDVICSCSSPTDKIVITGEFDNWQHSDYILEYDGKEGYKVEIPRLTGRERALFKFLVNDNRWITLSYFETLTDEQGFINNVLNYHDYDGLDDVTINSSTQDENEQQEKLLSYSTEVTDAKYMSPELFSHGKLEANSSSNNPVGSNDYVNISSHGELSSIEDLEFEPYESDLEETIQYDSKVSFSTNQKPLDGLVSMVKKARTYWHT